MPQFMKIFGYHIYFWSNENKPLEPIHVHVSKNIGPNTTKFWIRSDGSTELDNNNSQIPNKDLKKLSQVITVYSEDIIKQWEDFFQQEATFIDSQSFPDLD